LLTQFFLGVVFIFLGQAGTSVKGAYDVLVSMGVITYFIPYLYLFAAMIKLQREPAGPDVIRVPGRNDRGKANSDRRIPDHDADDRTVSDSAAGRAEQAAGTIQDMGGTGALVLIRGVEN
jgi:hypothetical protein